MAIKGKAKAKFGIGDIRMTSILSKGVGAVVLETQEKHEIGERIPLEKEWCTKNADVILSFTKTESIDALIENLKEVKQLMNGETEGVEVLHEKVDLDKFME